MIRAGGFTEEEAKTKWCAFARARADAMFDADGSDGQPFAANRAKSGKADKWCLCLGSDCMSWRWIGEPGQEIPPEKMEGFCVDRCEKDGSQAFA